MAASISDAPPLRALSGDPIRVIVATDADISAPASIRLDLSFTVVGPSVGDTLRIQWAGNDLTFVCASSPSAANPLEIPVKGADSMFVYLGKLASRFMAHETLQASFKASLDGDVVVLTQRARAVLDITTTSTLLNVVVTVEDVTAVTTPANLRAVLQVWNHAGDITYEDALLTLHSPYDLNTASTEFEIQDAFARLQPDLPDEFTIVYASVPGSLPNGTAFRMAQRYYLRYADKGGSPAVAEALVRHPSDTADYYLAVHGSTAANSNQAENTFLRRNTLLSGGTLVFPITCEQPDWVYVLVGESGSTGARVEIEVRWSDGTTSVHNPFGTGTVSIDDTTPIAWYPSGYKQMLLDTVNPSGSTDPDATIVGYIWKLKSEADANLALVNYAVHQVADYNHHLLFDNGVGGLESVAMRGKATFKYEASGEVYEKNAPDTDLESGETDFGTLSTYNQKGRPVWTLSTGWYSDPQYLQHLQQLLLGAVWLIDTEQNRFLRAIVDTREIETHTDDETLFAFTITLKAAWYDAAFNQ